MNIADEIRSTRVQVKDQVSKKFDMAYRQNISNNTEKIAINTTLDSFNAPWRILIFTTDNMIRYQNDRYNN